MHDRVILVVALGLGISACDRIPGTPTNAARDAVTASLFDPYSAKLRYLATTPKAVCGVVNAKNRMGAYVGETAFIAPRDGGRVALFHDAPSINDYATWSRNSEGEAGRSAYQRLEDGCAFPERWQFDCQMHWLGPEGDHKVCDAWRRRDYDALINLREETYRR
ncbi:hypothetical protein [Brevundimonas nasdae]|uniref:Lipoprotein n=1 Tax=Brevundimonas nasdae TaxID=172043 RepID=A0ABX8TKI0_9CAUL|nr:hypothetical protein [Brevundimonas nasdae]QYC10588.1 hypothetical protein KWG56_00750 [Brevundimonas nasdae]QYC13375.1 hypothetical protein KWG63_14305 [Brevundimonas nasdae]